MSSLRRLPSSPLAAAAVLDDDDLLSEILLRLPPQPSSLPRASIVCKRWRRLVSDPVFTHRFRIRHRGSPPLVGCFGEKTGSLAFLPTMEAPNRVPPGRLSSHLDKRYEVLGCRHGLVLILAASWERVLVFDPVAADRRWITVPEGFGERVIHGAVLRAAGEEVQHFQVVLTAADDKDKQHRQALACVYSSESGEWGDLISAPLPPRAPMSDLSIVVYPPKPAVLVENCLYWMLAGDLVGILEFDLERKSIAVIHAPVDVFREGNHRFTVMRALGGGLGFLFFSKSECIAQLWKRMTDRCGVASWVLDRTIELDKVLSLNSWEQKVYLWILGFAEENNVVFLWTLKGIFMIHLESLQFEKLSGCPDVYYHPFETVYAAGM